MISLKSFPEKHFIETRELAFKLEPSDVGIWLLQSGFYPEQYVLPPCFDSKSLKLNEECYIKNIKKLNYNQAEELITISYPKSTMTDRVFGIMHPKYYHDIVWYIVKNWQSIIDHLFNENTKIYSYSFPIPVSKNKKGEVTCLRSGRMIYMFLEMAEKDLVADSHRFKYILHTDITNFYGSIYTHTIGWALYTKEVARNNMYNFKDYPCLAVDKLVYYSNDLCTNGIPIGPALSDLIAEIVLVSIDRKCSDVLCDIEFVGVRYKDDYRFLCKSEADAKQILKTLQESLREFRLNVNESKSTILTLPDGIYRKWTSEYYHYSLRRFLKINFTQFEYTIRAILQIDEKFPGTGVIDRFLSELFSKKQKMKLILQNTNLRIRTYSLLLQLRERRPKSYAFILAIIEAILTKYPDDIELFEYVKETMNERYKELSNSKNEMDFELLWTAYFLKVVLKEKIQSGSRNPLVESVINEKQEYFKDFNLFSFNPTQKSNHLLTHLQIFNLQQSDEENS